MTEHGLASTLTEMPLLTPLINGDPIHQMESYLDTTVGTPCTTNYSQMMTHPKRYTRWPSCPQYWVQQIILVHVNPGEILTIKSNDGSIQNIQGPADVPLMSPSGTLPPIYLPPGYMSQVVEENGIRKIIIVPQTIDYYTTMSAPIQVPHFIAPTFMYPQATQLIYPTSQGEFLPPYIQEPVPQQLPPPPLLPPPPPKAWFMSAFGGLKKILKILRYVIIVIIKQYSLFLLETYSHGTANYNQLDERAGKMEEHMKKEMQESQIDGHKNSCMITNTSLLLNQANDYSSIPGTLSTYTVDYAPSTCTVDSTSSTYTVDNTFSTYTVDNVPCTYTIKDTLSTCTVNNALNIYTADNTPSTDTVDHPSSTYFTDNTPLNSSTDHASNISTTDTDLHPSTSENSGQSPSSTNYASKTSTSDSTPTPPPIDSTPSSSIPDSAPNPPISESAPSTSATDVALNTDNATSTSNAASAHVEIGHENKCINPGSEDIKQKPGGKRSKSPSSNTAEKECRTGHGKSCCFSIEKPVVSDIQTSSAVISWKTHGSEKCNHTKSPVTFELEISNSGKNGKYINVYIGDEFTFTLLDLQPFMAYFVRITTVRGSAHRTVSKVVSFTTPGFKPDPPLAPKLINRSKSSLNLQWKGSNGNGSKINSFFLEWDEGKGEDFKSCYIGTMKQHKILKLNASTKYSFRLAAKNKFGLSDFSEIAVFHTSGIMPPTPSPPKLKEAGICNLSLEWCAPTNTNPNDSLTYVLEMEEAGFGLGFKPQYNGEDLSCTIRNLQRSTTYKFRIFACNAEGRSNPSREVKYATCPDKPGSPKKPYIKGKIHAHRVKIGWEPPEDNGGTNISSYSLEVRENLDVNFWNIIYNGTTTEFLYNHLQPGTTYKLRVFCTSPIGHSQPSDILTVQTPNLSPASCRPPPLNGKVQSKESNIQCNNSPTKGNSEALTNVKKVNGNQDDAQGHSGSEVRCTVSKFIPREFSFWLKATNKSGETKLWGVNIPAQSFSGSHSSTCETAPVPSPPTQCGIPVLTCKSPTCVVVSWEIPACNVAEITDYRLEWGQTEDSMHLIYTGPCLSYEVKGLIPATMYFCRVQAVNIVGVGMFGETGIVTTPATVPAVVTVLQEFENKVPAKLASSCIAIQWEEPDCHGSAITGYNIEYGDRKILTVNRVTECLLENLQPDTTYRIRIQAINHYGLSPFSQSIRTKTKPLPPEPPRLDCVVYGHQSLKLKWGNSSSKRLLSNLTSYNLLMGDRSDRFSIIYHGPCQSHKVQRLSEHTQYKFKIQACNEAGEGPLSGIYTFTTTKTPPATLKAPKLHHLNNNTCEVKWESLEPINGDSIVYSLQVISGSGTDLIYKGPNTSFSFSNFLTNSHYHFKVCAGRQCQNSAGIQELWGQCSPSALFSTYKQQPGPGKDVRGRQGSSPSEGKHEKPKIEMSDDTFVLILVIGFALIAIQCAAMIQYLLIN
ncbi:TPA: fibronectin type III domain containing 3C1-like [Bos taurus]|nr:TPA: fibronectin type III domain containing 3C1-like [Bos taurus]